MISQKYITDNMVVSIVRFDNQRTKKPIFYLACAFPVNIRWADNKVEVVDLMTRVEIEMKMLSKFKFLVGKALTTQEAEKNITGDRLNQLVIRASYEMTQRIESGFLPDRLTGEKKHFKKIYEVTQKGDSKI